MRENDTDSTVRRARVRPAHVLSTYLAQGNISLRPAEFLWLILLSAVMLASLGLLLSKSLEVTLVAGLVGAFLPPWYLARARRSRLTAFDYDLPNALRLMATSARAGYSVLQALEICARELRPPVSEEFRRAVEEMKMGVPIDEALAHLRRRAGNSHLDGVITAARVHRSVGGNWPEFLDKKVSHMLMWRGLVADARSLCKPPFRWLVVIATGIVLVQWVLFPGPFHSAWQTVAGRATLVASFALLTTALLTSAATARSIGGLAVEGAAADRIPSLRSTVSDLAVGALCVAVALTLGVPATVVVALGVIVLSRTALGLVVGAAVLVVLANGFLASAPRVRALAALLGYDVGSAPGIFATLGVAQGPLSSSALVTVALASAVALGVLSAIARAHARRPGHVLPSGLLTAQRFRKTPLSLEHIELSRSLYDRVVSTSVEWLRQSVFSMSPGAILRRAEQRLELAGNPANLPSSRYLAVRVGLAVVLGGLAFYLTQPAWYWVTGLFVVLGYLLPEMWLTWLIRLRQGTMLHAIPDLVGMLVLCAEADLNQNASLREVAVNWDHPLGRELGRVVQQIRAGKLRRDALRGMAARLDVPEIWYFFENLILFEEVGLAGLPASRIASEGARSAYLYKVESRIRDRISAWRVPAQVQLIALIAAVVLWFLAPSLG